jgi:hypothetical protein
MTVDLLRGWISAVDIKTLSALLTRNQKVGSFRYCTWVFPGHSAGLGALVPKTKIIANNLYTLARVVAMAEKNTKDDQYRDYMCSQCGDIYNQAGYKVVQIPMPRASPAPTSFAVKKEECPTVTQELVGPSKIPKNKDNL